MKHIIKIASLFLIYGLIFIIFSYPLINHFTDGFIGSGNRSSDSSVYIWNSYNFKDNFQHAKNPFSTEKFFYPLVTSLIFHGYTPILGIIYLFFDNIFFSTNAVITLSFILSAIGAFLLCYRFVPNIILSFICGFIFAFSPYKLTHLSYHYVLMLTATIPFFIISFLNAFEFKKERVLPRIKNKYSFIFCWILAIITLLSDYYAIFFLIYFCIIYFLYQKLSPICIQWSRIKRTIVLALIFICSHLLVVLFRYLQIDDLQGFYWGGDLAAYLIPFGFNSFLNNNFTDYLFNISKFKPIEGVMFLGFGIVVLIPFSIIYMIRKKIPVELKPIALCTFIFIMITLPELRIFGFDLFYLPTSLLHFIPFFNNIRNPTRFVLMVTLFLPILCFYALNYSLLSKLKSYWKIVLSLILAVLLVIEYFPNGYPIMLKSKVPKIYSSLANKEGEVLLPIPLGIRDGYRELGLFNTKDMFYQIYHHKKILGGLISRVDNKTYNFYMQDSVISQIIRMEIDTAYIPRSLTNEEISRFLNTFKPNFILISPTYKNSKITFFIISILRDVIKQKEENEGFLLLSINLNKALSESKTK